MKRLIFFLSLVIASIASSYAGPNTWDVLSKSIDGRWECKNDPDFPFFFVVKDADGQTGSAEGLFAGGNLTPMKGTIRQSDNGVDLQLNGTAGNGAQLSLNSTLECLNYGQVKLKGTFSISGAFGIGKELDIDATLSNPAMADTYNDSWREEMWKFLSFFTENNIISFSEGEYFDGPTHKMELAHPGSPMYSLTFDNGIVNAKLEDGTTIKEELIPCIYVQREGSRDGIIL